MAKKRANDESDVPTQGNSKAVRFNAHTLKKLQAAIDDDPEIDLTTRMPIDYSSRLPGMRSVVDGCPERKASMQTMKAQPSEDIRDSLCASDPLEILYPLSHAVSELLEDVSKIEESSPNGHPQRLCQLLRSSAVIWKAAFARQKMVFKCSPDIVVKAVRNIDDYTEYTTLQYLERHKPNIPAPKALGLVSISGISLIFMGHMRSTSLGEIWQTLDCDQKSSPSGQLNTILIDLRSLYIQGAPLGGVGREGCKDIRRHLRRSETPITSLCDFEAFMSSSQRPGGHVFTELLRRGSPPSQGCSVPHIVFTHGDLRPDNIVVEMTGGKCVITGILDWEYSGFYPDYVEAVRCINCLAPYENDDWFLYLPECISPKRYAHWWLLD